jgi:toxin ParE1/3/4
VSAARFRVTLTAGAQGDLTALHAWIADNRSPDQADALLDRLIEKIGLLETFPERGAVPDELAALGIREFRQTVLPPYRLVYRVIGQQVAILLIADGRRNMRSLLEERLLRP